MRKRIKFSHRAKIKARIHANKLRIQRLKRRINFHRKRYTEEMLILFRNADNEGRQKLEALFFRTTGESLEKLYREGVIESLKKNVP